MILISFLVVSPNADSNRRRRRRRHNGNIIQMQCHTQTHTHNTHGYFRVKETLVPEQTLINCTHIHYSGSFLLFFLLFAMNSADLFVAARAMVPIALFHTTYVRTYVHSNPPKINSYTNIYIKHILIWCSNMHTTLYIYTRRVEREEAKLCVNRRSLIILLVLLRLYNAKACMVRTTYTYICHGAPCRCRSNRIGAPAAERSVHMHT